MTKNRKNLFLLLGISFVLQASTSLTGGLIGIGPFTQTGNMAETMSHIAAMVNTFYLGIFLQVITAVVIIVLGAALYQAGCHINKTVAIIAFALYLVEVVLLLIDQVLKFSVVEISLRFVIADDLSLLTAAELLFASIDFVGAVSMMPFGIGAILFYTLITKAAVIPKWLGGWGVIAVSFIFVGWTLSAFKVASVPFVMYVPYVPWEWVAGIYIIVKTLKESSSIQNE